MQSEGESTLTCANANICVSVYVAARNMMGITQIVRGSKYGKQKSLEKDKKIN